MSDAYDVVRQFEGELCRYTGAPYAVTVTSCTMALLLAVSWHLHGPSKSGRRWPDGFRPAVEIPNRTYVSVPMSIIHAGGRLVFRDEDWHGCYQLKPLPVWDCARMFTSGMYRSFVRLTDMRGPMQAVSFHSSKILGDTQGGAILHDNAEADAWLRRARFDGRSEGVPPKEDTFTHLGWHCAMQPDTAARLLVKLSTLPLHNDPLPLSEYPDLSKIALFL